ncbi:MAG: NAD-dependent glutamate dehydrogenase, partial [Ramlibacter sp.]|nr:NAD-dependent glutamate dehydrogenase [Ramlibacter sp.]
MNASAQALHNRVDAVLALAASRLDAAAHKMIEGFAREYFARLDADDLAERTPEDLLGALLSHLQLGEVREPGRPKLRIFGPTQAEDGWSSRHSVIQIVNDDMPFLVDSTSLEINRQGLTLHLIVHPIFAVRRDKKGKLESIGPQAQSPDAPRESWMHIEVDRLIDAEQRDALAAGIEQVLADVRAAVTDWRAMLAKLHEAIAELQRAPAALPRPLVAENAAFLQWLADGHMTLLGYRQHDLVDERGEAALRLVRGSGLGLLRDTEQEKLSVSFAALPAQARALAKAPLPLLVVTKANTRSTVHRAGYTDYIGVKRYNATGEVIGEHRFIGLFTSTAYSARVAETPLLRGKVEAIAAAAGLPAGGHLAKALDHVLETYPRDDLFQIPDEQLYDTALGIVALGERQRLRLFMWRDPFDRFVSCLVYVPREAYSTDLRVKFQRILMAAFGGTSAEFDVLLSDAVLARIHFTVRTTPGQVPAYERKDIERQLAAAARRWDDELRDALVDEEGEGAGLTLFKRWSAAFPAAYRDRVAARDAVPDVRKLAAVSTGAPLELALYQPPGAAPGALGLKIYLPGAPLVLSDSLPMLEHMGVRVIGESSWRIGTPDDAHAIFLHDFELQAPAAGETDAATRAGLFEGAFARVLSGEIESDDF